MLVKYIDRNSSLTARMLDALGGLPVMMLCRGLPVTIILTPMREMTLSMVVRAMILFMEGTVTTYTMGGAGNDYFTTIIRAMISLMRGPGADTMSGGCW